MIRKRAFVMISLSLAMGVFAAWIASNWVQARTAPPQEVAMATVVAADLAIPFATKIENRHLKTLEMPAQYVPPGSFSTTEAVIGRVALQHIVPGEILMKERFVDSEDGSTLAALVGDKMRAMTVRVDDVIGVAGFLLPGNRVDVLASRMEQSRRATSETIVRDVKVLAVDQTAATEKNEPVIVRAVTLEVTPAQAEVLVKAKEEGSLQLTLRNPLDDEPFVEPEAPKPVRRAQAAAPPAVRSVTVIRGTEVTTTKPRT